MNNKGHFGFTTGEKIFLGTMLYGFILSFITLGCFTVASMIKLFFFKKHSVYKITAILVVLTIISLCLWGMFNQWHWQHYGYYYHMRDNIIKSPTFYKEYSIDANNGSIYKYGKPYIIHDTYYGWKDVYEEEKK